MDSETQEKKVYVTEYRSGKWRGGGEGCGAIYFFGFLGALVYYIQHAASFWMGVLGVLKAIVWPGMIVYRVLELLKF